MTTEELHILQHSLGLDQYGRGTFYRNHFCTGAGSVDHPHCMSLFEKGFMTRRANVEMFGGSDMFFVTEAGKAACLAESPKSPKLTRSQQRYSDYLALTGGAITFIEYLRSYHGKRKAA